MSKHTSGPWRLAGEDQDRITGPVDGAKNVTATIAVCNYGLRHNDEVAANARLIAAAPEMLELLLELEWSEYDEAVGAKEACPICGRVSRTGHTASCRLAAVLKSLEGT